MSDKPIERLNYFNGQRLEADDLRLEQDYHIQIQRWLMKTLFWPGVASGFNVHVLPGGQKIRLDPGLALDDLGRAIILVAPVELTPQARLLCLRYAERKERQQVGSCTVTANGGGAVPASWGGPERILSQPDIFWRADPPARDTRELIIAELLLNPDCTVQKVAAGPRLHASPLPVQQVRQLSFEGEKDIDEHNPKVITFYIRGPRPNAVTLYLRAKQFSTLYYSEMGQVTPRITGGGTAGAFQTSAPDGVDAHRHDHGTLFANLENPPHAHDVVGRVDGPPPVPPFPSDALLKGPSFMTGQDTFANAGVGFQVIGNAHTHPIAGLTDTPQDVDLKHTHTITINISPTGSAGPTTVRDGNQLTYLSNLQITIGKRGGTSANYGAKILQYVKDNNSPSPPNPWGGETVINGQPGNPLVTIGTGPIRLDLIDGLSFEPDQVNPYEITLSVAGNGNGGCIEYSLYVE
jgi:hypothetical protein